MSDETIKTADWAPGTLDNTRKNIGDLSDVEAADMAKKQKTTNKQTKNKIKHLERKKRKKERKLAQQKSSHLLKE